MRAKQSIGLQMVFLLLAIVWQGGVSKVSCAEKVEWKLAKRSKDISLFYRWVLKSQDKTREMKAEFTIDADILTILDQFTSEENYMKWAAGIRECGIEKYNDTIWYTHSVVNYPWPLRKKDLVTRHWVKQNDKVTLIVIDAAPEFRPEIEGIERVENYHGTWKFTKISNEVTLVDYRVISYEKPVLPRVVQDPVIQRISINSFAELRKITEEK